MLPCTVERKFEQFFFVRFRFKIFSVSLFRRKIFNDHVRAISPHTLQGGKWQILFQLTPVNSHTLAHKHWTMSMMAVGRDNNVYFLCLLPHHGRSSAKILVRLIFPRRGAWEEFSESWRVIKWLTCVTFRPRWKCLWCVVTLNSSPPRTFTWFSEPLNWLVIL